MSNNISSRICNLGNYNQLHVARQSVLWIKSGDLASLELFLEQFLSCRMGIALCVISSAAKQKYHLLCSPLTCLFCWGCKLFWSKVATHDVDAQYLAQDFLMPKQKCFLLLAAPLLKVQLC